ncbi:MAG: sel1 repeat family protein, partial [Thermoguttaceae bacterium]|nr:sel1 repeat family protein [Thermoguttaceae bacterium]
MTQSNDRFPLDWDNWSEIFHKKDPDEKEKGTEEDLSPKQRREKLRRDAENGIVSAQLELAICLFTGRDGFKEDRQEAVDLFRAAAEKGFAPAQCCLALCLYNGIGRKEDSKPEETFMWFQAAAEQG